MLRPLLTLAAIAALVLLAGCGGAGPATGTKGSPTTARHRPPTLRVDLSANPAQIAARAHVPVLCYHQIRNWRASDTATDRPYIMPPARFRAEMAALAAHRYHTITPAQLLAHVTTGQRLPSRPVLLTFDDADEQQYTVGLPVLRRHGFTATFFVMTVVLDKPNYMSTRQVRALDRAGMKIGGHTWDHHRVDQYAGDDWRIQIDQPTRTLARIVGHPIRYFAYPYGAWSPAAFPHLTGAGYLAAFQLSDKPVDRHAPLLTLRRQIADPYLSTAAFLRNLRSGF